MKQFRTLFMLAIGMIVFTATASTAKLEQKQKTELIKEFAPHINAVNVANDFTVVPVLAESTIFSNFKVQTFVLKPVKLFTTVDDVGWSNYERVNRNYDILKRLTANRMQIVYLNHRTNIPIRNNC